MDLDKTYNNSNLESRRKALLRTQRAVEHLRRHKDRRPDARAQIVAAFDSGTSLGPLGAYILRQFGSRKHPIRMAHRDAMRRLLLRADDESDLPDDMAHAEALIRLAGRYDRWIRQPEDWRARSHNARRQLASLARHLLAAYDVPSFMDAAWTSVSYDRASTRRHQDWFIHIGRGENIRKAAGLPVPLTKMMAHHVLLAPDECTIPQAIRWGQLQGIGGSRAITHAILGSRIGDHFAGAEVEAFWTTVFQFFVQHPMIDPHQVGPIIDYLHNQRFESAGRVNVNGTLVLQPPPQPGLSMKGRTPDTLVAQVDAWHARLRRERRAGGPALEWPSCGVRGFDRVEGEPGNQRRFTITELLSASELRAEGAAMHHCVATYAGSCHTGRSAIFSLKCESAGVLHSSPERRVTIELDVRRRQITQVRSKHNAPSTPLDQRVLNAWATTAGLTFSRFALTRWA